MQYKIIRYWEYAETFYVEADSEAEALESTNDREPDMIEAGFEIGDPDIEEANE